MEAAHCSLCVLCMCVCTRAHGGQRTISGVTPQEPSTRGASYGTWGSQIKLG